MKWQLFVLVWLVLLAGILHHAEPVIDFEPVTAPSEPHTGRILGATDLQRENISSTQYQGLYNATRLQGEVR